jgi:hypothetical protein
MKLGEGADMRVMTGDEYLALPNIIYWEALAIAFVKGNGLDGEHNKGKGFA